MVRDSKVAVQTNLHGHCHKSFKHPYSTWLFLCQLKKCLQGAIECSLILWNVVTDPNGFVFFSAKSISDSINCIKHLLDKLIGWGSTLYLYFLLCHNMTKKCILLTNLSLPGFTTHICTSWFRVLQMLPFEKTFLKQRCRIMTSNTLWPCNRVQTLDQ